MPLGCVPYPACLTGSVYQACLTGSVYQACLSGVYLPGHASQVCTYPGMPPGYASRVYSTFNTGGERWATSLLVYRGFTGVLGRFETHYSLLFLVIPGYSLLKPPSNPLINRLKRAGRLLGVLFPVIPVIPGLFQPCALLLSVAGLIGDLSGV